MAKDKKNQKSTTIDSSGDRLSIIKSMAKRLEMSTLDDPDEVGIVKTFISSGSTLLDLALGGKGWACGRVVNIIGDESSGKSLLVGEALAYTQRCTDGLCALDEGEATFDPVRARNLGVKPEEVIRPNSRTVEDWYNNVTGFVEAVKTVQEEQSNPELPCIYALDSLDSLCSDAELEREIDESSYGGEKAKKLSEFFRKLTKPMGEANLLLMVVSQTRDKIGVTFGEKQTVSGGKALKFYCSQRVKLSEIGKITTESGGDKRVIGVKVRAKVIKNKVGDPFLEVEFPILFTHGIDDMGSCIAWLRDKTKALGTSSGWYEWEGKKFREADFISFIESNNLEEEIRIMVRTAWAEWVESTKIVRKPKYA